MKILIVKTSALGDIIHTFPTLHFLRAKFPGATIDWVAEQPYAELIQAHPDVSHVLTVETKRWRKELWKPATWKKVSAFRQELRSCTYDLLFDLQGNLKSGSITSQAKAKIKIGFGLKTVPEWPNCLFTNQRFNPPSGQNIRADSLFLAQSFCQDFTPFEAPQVLLQLTLSQKEWLEQYLKKHSEKNWVMVCPGSAWRNKQLTEETLKEFLKQLQLQLGCQLLLVWGSQEEHLLVKRLQQDLPDSPAILERLPLPLLQNLMAHMSLIIAMDSLPLHLAATTGTATFSIFGASSSAKYRPIGKQHLSYQGACPYGRKFEKRCPVLRSCTTGSCIRELTGDEIFKTWQEAQAQMGFK